MGVKDLSYFEKNFNYICLFDHKLTHKLNLEGPDLIRAQKNQMR